MGRGDVQYTTTATSWMCLVSKGLGVPLTLTRSFVGPRVTYCFSASTPPHFPRVSRSRHPFVRMEDRSLQLVLYYATTDIIA